MYSLRKVVFESFNLKNALKELVLIVASILIALAITDWNDERKERLVEIEILRELGNSLNSDVSDLNGNYKRVTELRPASEAIRQFMNHELPFQDSLPNALAKVCQGYSYFVSNRAAFESLKARGLDLISNDSLRLRIITLYEITYKIVERGETRRLDVITDKLNYYGPQFQQMNAPGAVHRKEFNTLMNDQDFNRFLFSKFVHDQRITEGHSRLSREVAELARAINKEIDRLKN